jgi:hypothetical protein
MNTVLKEKLSKVIDLLEYKFDVTKSVHPELVEHEKIKVFIMADDVIGLKLKPEELHKLLDLIVLTVPNVEIQNLFEYNDYALGVLEFEKEYTGEERAFIEVLLPKDFMQLIATLENNESKNNSLLKIEKIELLADETARKKITVYINTDYKKERSYKRGINWSLMYELAESNMVDYKKSFFDYFNSNVTNPLYSKKEFKLTQVLKKQGEYIVPNIEIKIITSLTVSRRRNKA